MSHCETDADDGRTEYETDAGTVAVADHGDIPYVQITEDGPVHAVYAVYTSTREVRGVERTNIRAVTLCGHTVDLNDAHNVTRGLTGEGRMGTPLGETNVRTCRSCSGSTHQAALAKTEKLVAWTLTDDGPLSHDSVRFYGPVRSVAAREAAGTEGSA